MARAELMDFDKALELFEPVLGFEVHVELNTKTKMFSAAPNPANSDVPRRRAEHARHAGVPRACPGRCPSSTARRCGTRSASGSRSAARSPPSSRFARKNYFYPDLGKNYQISQYDEPIAFEGSVEVELADGTRRHGADRARAHGGGRRQAHARRRLDRPHPGRRVLARRLQPRRRAARRDRHEADLRRRAPTRPSSRRRTCRRSATSCSRSASPRRAWSAATSAATRTSRCARAARRSSARAPRRRT